MTETGEPRWIRDEKTDEMFERQADGSYKSSYWLIRLDEKLPCDVMVAPRTIIKRGCDLSTLLLAISRRRDLPDGESVRIKFNKD